MPAANDAIKVARAATAANDAIKAWPHGKDKTDSANPEISRFSPQRPFLKGIFSKNVFRFFPRNLQKMNFRKKRIIWKCSVFSSEIFREKNPKIWNLFRNSHDFFWCFLEFFMKMQELLEKRGFYRFLAFLRFRDCSHRKERKKCCKMSNWTLKNSPIQPRTRHLKFPKIW